MSERESVPFTGTLLRFERDGFGIVRFDLPIGPSANSYGVISSTAATTIVQGSFALQSLTPGARVTGVAEADERDVASVKSVTVQSSS